MKKLFESFYLIFICRYSAPESENKFILSVFHHIYPKVQINNVKAVQVGGFILDFGLPKYCFFSILKCQTLIRNS